MADCQGRAFLMAQGVPEELIDVANDKLAAINTAYDTIAKARGITVHHLNIGQPDIATPRAMIEAYQRYDERVLAYAPSDGYRAYRDKLAV